MYGHCEIEDLVRQRRMPMIIAEVLSYKADIVCLQEVDAAIHNTVLRPALEANGYQGFYSNKVREFPSLEVSKRCLQHIVLIITVHLLRNRSLHSKKAAQCFGRLLRLSWLPMMI